MRPHEIPQIKIDSVEAVRQDLAGRQLIDQIPDLGAVREIHPAADMAPTEDAFQHMNREVVALGRHVRNGGLDIEKGIEESFSPLVVQADAETRLHHTVGDRMAEIVGEIHPLVQANAAMRRTRMVHVITPKRLPRPGSVRIIARRKQHRASRLDSPHGQHIAAGVNGHPSVFRWWLDAGIAQA